MSWKSGLEATNWDFRTELEKVSVLGSVPGWCGPVWDTAGRRCKVSPWATWIGLWLRCRRTCCSVTSWTIHWVYSLRDRGWCTPPQYNLKGGQKRRCFCRNLNDSYGGSSGFWPVEGKGWLLWAMRFKHTEENLKDKMMFSFIIISEAKHIPLKTVKSSGLSASHQLEWLL